MDPSAAVSVLAEERRRGLFALRPDAMDVRALAELRVRACQPQKCGGKCCKDGAGLLPSEAVLLEAVSRDHARELLALGLKKVPAVTDASGRSARTEVDGTACAWLLGDGRCSLQALAVEHGQSPWFYKPLACVLFPLRVRTCKGLCVLTADPLSACREDTADVPDCARWRAECAPLAGLQGEAAYIKELWGHDVSIALESPVPEVRWTADVLEVIGLTATSKKHAVWACVSSGGEFLAVKQPLTQTARERLGREQRALAQLGGDGFPSVSLEPIMCDGHRTTVTRFHRTMISLGSWLRMAPPREGIEAVAQGLLRACERLERLGLVHGDMAFKNVLVHPRRWQTVLADLENAGPERDGSCAGNGDFGTAAPELYLNHPGAHTCRTDSFFVGAFLFYALNRRSRSDGIAFPFVEAAEQSDPLWSVMWALLGDPLARYDPATRLPAGEVLHRWKRGTLPRGPIGPLQRSYPVAERLLRHSQGAELRFHSRGIELRVGRQVLARREGLVDVAATPESWTGDELVFGKLRISATQIRPIRAAIEDSPGGIP
jgi:hypothetical protein